MEGGSGVIRCIIDELHSLDIQGDEMEGESCVPRISLMNFILMIANEIKLKVNVVLLGVS